MTEQHALLPSDHCTSTFAVEAPSEWIGRKIARGGAYIPTLPPARSKRQVCNFRWPHVCNIGRPLTLELESLSDFASDPYLMELVRELDGESQATALTALRDFSRGVMDAPASSFYHLESALLSLEMGRASPLEDPDGQIEDPEGRIALDALEVYRAWSHAILFGVENQ